MILSYFNGFRVITQKALLSRFDYTVLLSFKVYISKLSEFRVHI